MNRRLAFTIGSFAVKGLCALLITWRLGNLLTVTDFAVWGALFSFGMILSVADFGVGQLVLTTLDETGRAVSGDAKLMSDALFTMLVLAGASWGIALLVVSATHLLDGVEHIGLLCGIIAMRLVCIPAGAALSAQERYHERKVAESVAYLGALAWVWYGSGSGANLSALLIGVNAFITLGSLAVLARAIQLRVGRIAPMRPDLRAPLRMIRGAFPYFVNNITGLIIYGGFVAFSALILAPAEIARLTLLHGLLFTYLYQLFELLFRTLQVRLRDLYIMRRLTLLVGAAACAGVVVAGAGGHHLMRVVFPMYTFTGVELCTYVAFVFLEVYYLLLTSRLQMRSQDRMLLRTFSFVKAGVFMGSIGLIALVGAPVPLMSYAAVLVTSSLLVNAALHLSVRRASKLACAAPATV